MATAGPEVATDFGSRQSGERRLPAAVGDIIGLVNVARRLHKRTQRPSTPPGASSSTGDRARPYTDGGASIREPDILHRTTTPEFLVPGSSSRMSEDYSQGLPSFTDWDLKWGARSSNSSPVVLASLARNRCHDFSHSDTGGFVRSAVSGRSACGRLPQPEGSSLSPCPIICLAPCSHGESDSGRDIADDTMLSVFDSLGENEGSQRHLTDQRRIGCWADSSVLHQSRQSARPKRSGLRSRLPISWQWHGIFRSGRVFSRGSLRRIINESLRSQLSQEQTLIGETSSMRDHRDTACCRTGANNRYGRKRHISCAAVSPLSPRVDSVISSQLLSWRMKATEDGLFVT